MVLMFMYIKLMELHMLVINMFIGLDIVKLLQFLLIILMYLSLLLFLRKNRRKSIIQTLPKMVARSMRLHMMV